MSSYLGDYLAVGIATLIGSIVLYTGVRFQFGEGIMVRLFRIIMLSISIIGFVGFVLGRSGITAVTLAIVFVVAITLVVTTIYVIKKYVIDHIRLQVDTVSGVATNLSATSAQAAASAEEQASSVAQVSSAVEEIHRMSQNTASTSQTVVKISGEAVDQGIKGIESVRQVSAVMERLSKTSDFVEVVNRVAEQSNLLAFNASIEAAKAEEYGRGFSVVASEVRNLAEQSKQAAKQIRESIRYTESGTEAIKTTDTVIAGLGTVLKETAEKARQISGAAVQQSAGIKQISDAMDNLLQGGKHTADTSNQIRQAVDELGEVSAELLNLLYGAAKRRAR